MKKDKCREREKEKEWSENKSTDQSEVPAEKKHLEYIHSKMQVGCRGAIWAVNREPGLVRFDLGDWVDQSDYR